MVGAGLLSEVEFQTLAEDALAEIELATGSLEDILDRIDVTNAMGVLTINLGSKGTYVINKQAPNRQLWWSSPISGPRRYQWHSGTRAWVSTRDGTEMLSTLRDEIRALTGVDLAIGGSGGTAARPRG